MGVLRIHKLLNGDEDTMVHAITKRVVKRVLAAGVLVAAYVSSRAAADPLMKYDYFDVGMQWLRIDGAEDRGPNYEASTLTSRFSYSPTTYLALEGGMDFRNGGSQSDSFSYRGGVLGYYPLTEDLHLVGRVGGVYRVNVFNAYDVISVNESSVYAGTGLRYRISKRLETDLDLNYTDKLEFPYSATGALLYGVTDHLALTTSMRINNNADTSGLVGIRVSMN
jgi:hypothetical protein